VVGRLTLCLLLAACASQPLTVTREPVALRLVAADSCAPLAQELTAAYEEARPWVTIHVEVFDNSLAERTLREGEADLALLSWLEQGQGSDEEGDGGPLWSHPLTRDGIAVVANLRVPFADAGLAFLHEIFRGQVQEWGGAVLTVVSREDGSGTRAAFESAVLGGYDVTRTAVVMPSSHAVLEHVARTEGAIGYVSTLWVGEAVPQAWDVRVLPVDGVSPTWAAIVDGSYPLSRSLYLAAVDEPSGAEREFAQWAVGSGGQAVALGLGDG
jgi:phosphate transport system substrate-binding protein